MKQVVVLGFCFVRVVTGSSPDLYPILFINANDLALYQCSLLFHLFVLHTVVPWTRERYKEKGTPLFHLNKRGRKEIGSKIFTLQFWLKQQFIVGPIIKYVSWNLK